MTSTDLPDPRAPGRPHPAPTRHAGHRVSLGVFGERLAVRYLREQGMEVIERNWRCEHGEVDVVALDGDCLVICEVKTRVPSAFGDPVEAVTAAKAMRLRRLAGAYLAAHPRRPGTVRVDVIGILGPPGAPPVLRHVVGLGT